MKITKRILAIVLALTFITGTTVFANARTAPTDAQIEAVRLQVLEEGQRLRFQYGLMTAAQETQFIDGQIAQQRNLTSAQFNALPFGERLALRRDFRTANPQITQTEINALRKEYGGRDSWYFQESVAEQMTYYRALLGLGSVEANKTLQRLAQEHAEAWVNSERSFSQLGLTAHDRPNGTLSRVVHQGVRDTMRPYFNGLGPGTFSIHPGTLGFDTNSYLPGFIDARASSVLMAGSIPHFNPWVSRVVNTTMYVGVGYAPVNDDPNCDRYFVYVMFAWGN